MHGTRVLGDGEGTYAAAAAAAVTTTVNLQPSSLHGAVLWLQQLAGGVPLEYAAQSVPSLADRCGPRTAHKHIGVQHAITRCTNAHGWLDGPSDAHGPPSRDSTGPVSLPLTRPFPRRFSPSPSPA